MCAQQSSKTLGLSSADFGEIFHPGGNMTNAPGLRSLNCFSQLTPLSFSNPSLLEYSSVANQPMIIEALMYPAKSSCAISENHFNLSELQLPHSLLGSVSRKQEIPALLILQGREESEHRGWQKPSSLSSRNEAQRDDVNAPGYTVRNRTQACQGKAFKECSFLTF